MDRTRHNPVMAAAPNPDVAGAVPAAPAAMSGPDDGRLVTLVLLTAILFSLLPAGLSWRDYDEIGASLLEGSWQYKLQWGSVFALSAWVVWRQSAFALATLRQINPFLLALVVYCMIGIAWSPEPVVTLKRAVQLGGLIVLGLTVQAYARQPTYLIKVLLVALMGIELASVIMVPINPSLAVESLYDGSWRGVLSAKNELGYVASLSLILWAVLWAHEPIRPSVLLPSLALSLLCLVMAKSSTSILMTGLGIFSFLLFRRQHIGSPLWLLRIVVVLVLGVALYMHIFFVFEARLPGLSDVLEPVANLFGKHADLTGRADIWAPLLVEIDKHWVLGLGYGAFWLGVGSASQPILDALPWVPYQAHNGYLDMLNELGAVGITLFAGFLLWHVRNLFQLTRVDRFQAAFHAMLLTCIIFTNFTESSFFRGLLFQHMLLMISCVAVTVALNPQVRPAPGRVPRPGPGRAAPANAAPPQHGGKPA